MYMPKISTKRALSAVAAAALAIGATVTVAGQSDAAAAIALSISPKSGPASATQVINVTGKGFKAGSTNLVGVVDFQAAACSAATSGTAAAAKSTVSATKLVVTAPNSLTLVSSAATPYYLCVYSSATGNALIGSAKYTVYPAPAITSLSTSSGSNLGGTSVDLVGTDFTKTTTVKFDAIPATKVTFVDSANITVITPAHAASATAVDVVVTTEGGSVTSAAAFTYKNAITVSPQSGGAALNTIDIVGAGFTSLTATNVMLGKLSTAALSGAATGTSAPVVCGNLQIVSSTELTCDVPAATTAGPYMVYVSNTLAGSGTFNTVVSSGAAYTVAPF